MRALPLLLAAVLLAGCQASPALDRLRGEDVAPEPVYLEHRAEVGPRHDASYDVPVGDRAVELNVTLRLHTRLPGLADVASPARLDVQLLAPSGTVVARAVVDPSNPAFAHHAIDFVERGTYVLRVAGQGGSGSLQGDSYGASYVLTVDVRHA